MLCPSDTRKFRQRLDDGLRDRTLIQMSRITICLRRVVENTIKIESSRNQNDITVIVQHGTLIHVHVPVGVDAHIQYDRLHTILCNVILPRYLDAAVILDNIFIRIISLQDIVVLTVIIQSAQDIKDSF